jgi:hypothetical protein
MKRILIAMALAATMVLGTATASLAFDPPDHNDASGLVDVTGFPGFEAQFAHAWEQGGAWNGHFHSDQIGE